MATAVDAAAVLLVMSGSGVEEPAETVLSTVPYGTDERSSIVTVITALAPGAIVPRRQVRSVDC